MEALDGLGLGTMEDSSTRVTGKATAVVSNTTTAGIVTATGTATDFGAMAIGTIAEAMETAIVGK
jgi:hypothetical protein